MELHDLRYFVAVAEDLHFGRAAERLYITQPALTRQIQSLEAELEVQLFQRTKRRVQLTTAGQEFLKEAKQILRHTEQAIQTAKRIARGEVGQLRLSFTPSALRGILPEIMRIFGDRYPEVRVKLTECCTKEALEAFRMERIDIGFLYPPVDEELLMLYPVVEETWIIALPKTNPLATSEQLSLKMLANECFILHPRQEGPFFYDRIIDLCQQAGFHPNVMQEVVNCQTRVGLVAAGLGIAIVPEYLENTADANVVYRRLQGDVPKLKLAIARRRDNFSPVVQQFLKVVEAIANNRVGVKNCRSPG
jgi:DNA-binding transcriptional LysR family regulator